MNKKGIQVERVENWWGLNFATTYLESDVVDILEPLGEVRDFVSACEASEGDCRKDSTLFGIHLFEKCEPHMQTSYIV